MPSPASAPARSGRALGPVRVGTARRAASTFAEARAFVLRHPLVCSFVLYGLIAAILRPATWYTPLFEDPAQNLYVGQAIFDGGAPYVDAANNKGPLTYLLFGFLGVLVGTSNVMLKFTVVIATAAAALLVATYVTRYSGRAVGFVAGLSFALFSGAADLLGYEPMTEVYGLVAMTAAWYLASRGGSRSVAGAGACAAVAILMNPAFGIIVPIAALEVWRRGREQNAVVELFAWALAGGAAVTALVALWLGLSGAIDDMLTQVIGHVTSNVTPGGAPATSQSFAPNTSEFYRLVTVPAGGLWIAAAVGAVLAWRTPELRPLAVPSLLWLVLAFLRVKVVDYELLHQFFLAMPGIAVGLAGGIASLWGSTTRTRVALATLVLAAPAIVYVIGPQWRALQLEPSARFGVGNNYAAAEPVADFVRENTAPEDEIFVGGHAAQVYWLADRRAPTRFFDIFPVIQDEGYRRERNRELNENPPQAIVIMADTPPDNNLRGLITRLKYQLAYEENGARVFLRF